MKPESKGMLLGLIAVAAFSLTLPATRAALESFHPIFVSAGRALMAAVLAAIYLSTGRHRRPTRQEFKGLLVVMAGVVFGFPVFTALALRHVDASHGGVMLGIMPLTVAASGFLLYKERPSPGFWVAALTGSALVMAFSVMRADGGLQWADVSLLLAVVTASVSYAVGSALSKTLGGLQVISWALLIAVPLWTIPAIIYAPASFHGTTNAWIGFIYVALFSQFLAFLPWFRGLAMGGIARVGQAQLLQPFLTILASALLLGESVDAVTIGFAVAVFAVVAIGRRSKIERRKTHA